MSLDKWLNGKKVAKKKKKEIKDIVINHNEDQGLIEPKKNNVKPVKKLKKYTLLCVNKKCKYKKTLMKSQISEHDKICPRCGKEMKKE